jgi:hypothetical protein
LSSDAGELKLNPVGVGARGFVSTLDAGQVRAMIAIEIGNGDRQPRSSRRRRSILNRPALCDAVPRGNEKHQQRDPEKRAGPMKWTAQGLPVIPEVHAEVEFARELSHSVLPSAVTFGDYTILEVARKGAETQRRSDAAARSSRTLGADRMYGSDD